MKQKTKTIISCAVACLVLALGVGALATASKGFTDWNTDNWGQNFKDLVNKDEVDPTEEKVDTLIVEDTDTNKTYLMPAKSLNFGNAYSGDDEEVVDTLEKSPLGVAKTMSKGVENNLMATGSSITYPQTINLSATVTPVEAEEYCEYLWEITWGGTESISAYITLENANTKNVVVKVLKPFNHTATLKVTATANGILPVTDTCSVEFYKQLTGIDLTMTGAMEDKILNEGDQITYTVTPKYSGGTVDQEDESEVVVTYSSLISDYTINYDFMKNDINSGKVAFSHNEFYNASGNFTGVNVLTGAGRNLMNAKLKTSSGDFKITATKGIYSKSINLDIDPEDVVYPESVQIGDGSDIEIGAN